MSSTTAATSAADALLSPGPFLTSGGLQTSLIYRSGYPLRSMATYPLLFSPTWSDYMRSILLRFADVSVEHSLPLILDTETWRALANWYDELATPPEDRAQVHRLALQHALTVAEHIEQKSAGKVRPVVQGVIGPRKDAYEHDAELSIDAAREYHREQIALFKEIDVPVVGAFTLTTSVEAIGIALEVNAAGLACLLSFTLDTDGLLPSGETLKDAVEKVDAAVDPRPMFYMVNCVHPRYVRRVIAEALDKGEAWVQRLKGVRGNASAKSHAELAQSTELDEGNPIEWAKEMVGLRELLPTLTVIGGCCGTDVKHCAEVAKLLK